MRSLVLRHYLLSLLVICLLCGISYVVYTSLTKDPLLGLTTAVVSRGSVEDSVAVSGSITSSNNANLAFPTSGIVSKIYFKEGDEVTVGEVIATLGAEGLVAERASALASLRLAQADKSELVSGVTTNEKNVTATTVAIAEADLDRIKSSQAVIVENAKRNLLNTTIAAKAISVNEDAAPPVISGTYNCNREGTYQLKPYTSSYVSGYSFTISGLESGTFNLSTKQPLPFGTCGLYALFNSMSQYSNSMWEIEIPNTKSSNYTTNKNAYDKAVSDADNAIGAATQALALAKSKQVLQNSAPRNEALTRAEAKISQAEAQIAQIDSRSKDRTIIAPFSGILTTANILEGETAGSAPVFSILSTDAFELVARIPEVDIVKIVTGQTADVVFDAMPQTQTHATVTYISPIPTQTNGVGYFEVKLLLNEQFDWIRSGLNADINIITKKKENVVVVPTLYIIKTPTGTFLDTLSDTKKIAVPVQVLFTGNDGLSEVSGIKEGTVIVAP